MNDMGGIQNNRQERVPEERPIPSNKTPEDYRIVVVEDDEDVARLWKEELTQEGYNVYDVRNEKELCEELERHPAPDLVIMDLELDRQHHGLPRDEHSPTPLGLELIKTFKERFGVTTGFIVITGMEDKQVLGELIGRHDVYDFIFKAVQNWDLCFRVQNALGRIETDKETIGRDALTGVHNRQGLNEKIDDLIRVWTRHLRKWWDFP